MRSAKVELDCTLTLIAEGLRRNGENIIRSELPKRYLDLIKVLVDREWPADQSLSVSANSRSEPHRCCVGTRTLEPSRKA